MSRTRDALEKGVKEMRPPTQEWSWGEFNSGGPFTSCHGSMEREPPPLPPSSIIPVGGKRSRETEAAAVAALRLKAREAKLRALQEEQQQQQQQQQQLQQQTFIRPAVNSAARAAAAGAGGSHASGAAAAAGGSQAAGGGVDIASLTQEVQTAPRFGLNGRALILRAAASASTTGPSAAPAPPSKWGNQC